MAQTLSRLDHLFWDLRNTGWLDSLAYTIRNVSKNSTMTHSGVKIKLKAHTACQSFPLRSSSLSYLFHIYNTQFLGALKICLPCEMCVIWTDQHGHRTSSHLSDVCLTLPAFCSCSDLATVPLLTPQSSLSYSIFSLQVGRCCPTCCRKIHRKSLPTSVLCCSSNYALFTLKILVDFCLFLVDIHIYISIYRRL